MRVCVEIDLSKPLLDTICVNLPESILFLNIWYEDIPKYCHYCLKLGHLEENCFVKHPEKRKSQHPEYEDARDYLNKKRNGKQKQVVQETDGEGFIRVANRKNSINRRTEELDLLFRK